jgi:hypothetical protein
MTTKTGPNETLTNGQKQYKLLATFFEDDMLPFLLKSLNILCIVPVRYHTEGSMKLNACILLLAHMVYLQP